MSVSLPLGGEALFTYFFPFLFPPAQTLVPPGALLCDTPSEETASFSLDPLVKMSVLLGWSLVL